MFKIDPVLKLVLIGVLIIVNVFNFNLVLFVFTLTFIFTPSKIKLREQKPANIVLEKEKPNLLKDLKKLIDKYE